MRRKDQHKKPRKKSHINESWLLPYSDMLTLIAALFIVLFAMSDINAQKYQQLIQVFQSEFSGSSGVVEENSNITKPEPDEIMKDAVKDENKNTKDQGAKELQKLQALQDKIDNYIKKNNLSEVLHTKLSGEGLMVSISNDVSFNSGSDNVNKYGRKIAKEISMFLYTNPPHQTVVSGHTDDIPIHNSEFSSNWELSAMRAINFMRLILENEKLNPEHFSSKGQGEHHPIVPNTSAENMAKNRRVEVLILPNYDISMGNKSEK